MADLTTICNALASQITAHTGLRALGQARDQITPPVAVVLPGNPLLRYGDTSDGTLTINLVVLIIISDAPQVDATQRALNEYLGIGSGETASIPGAIMADPSLGSVVHYCIPGSAGQYGRIEYSGVTYFGARLDLQLGAI